MENDVWIQKFRKEALPQIVPHIKPVRIFLFGSRVTGKATEESDMDVIIVSDTFNGNPFIKRMEMVLRIACFPKHIDFLCYTLKEFEKIKNTSSIIQDALEHSSSKLARAFSTILQMNF